VRLTFVALAVVLCGCAPSRDAAPRAPKPPPAKPSTAASITLPSDDGRVHIIDVPGRHETTRCLVHVIGQHSTIACLPPADLPRVELDR